MTPAWACPARKKFCLNAFSCYFAFALAANLVGTGCAYRLYAPVPPSEERVKVVAKKPDRYELHIEEYIPSVNESRNGDVPRTHISRAVNYRIPSDGLIAITVPSYRPYCGVYMFNVIKVGGGGDNALKDWKVSVAEDLRRVRVLSLRQLRELPTDAAGNRLLRIPD